MIHIDCFATGSSGNLYLVYNEDTRILLECGIPKEEIISNLRKKDNLRLSKLNGCIISHCHNDHCKSIEYVNQYLPVYANSSVFEKHSFNGFVIAHNSNFEIGSIRIKPIEVKHGKTPNLAFIFRDNDNTIFWGTDFSYVQNLRNFKFDSIYIEINYIEDFIKENFTEGSEDYIKVLRQINTHMGLEIAINYILKLWDLSRCKEINVIHMSLGYGNPAIIKERIEKEIGIPCKVYKKNGGVY